MVEKTSGDYSIGHLRIKYLDLANIGFAQNNFVQAKGFVMDFLDTVDENSEAGKIIKKEFDEIVVRKQKAISDLNNNVKELGYLERKDIENNGKEQIEVNSIHDMKEVCWRIAMQFKLFEDYETAK